MATAPVDLASCLFVTGPTAAGKTHIALELTGAIDGEIISMDSMAVYRGMDIGTAKPTPDQCGRVPHHLIDIVNPCDHYSVAQYVSDAHEKVREIRASGKQPIFVGGTPLYLKSLLRGIFVGPPADLAMRTELASVAAREGSEHLHARLEKVDPAAARRLHPRDTRRLIRALEVFATTGRPISELQGQFDHARPADELLVFAIVWPREQLNARIDLRVEQMFAEGLVEEVRRLVGQGQSLGKTASQAVGYREVLDFLAGRSTQEEMLTRTKLRTRQFAKRQMTWLRSLSECTFVDVAERLDPGAIARQIQARYERHRA